MPTNAPSYTSSKNAQSERAQVPIVTMGAHRGALLMQRAFAEFNRASNRFTLAPIYVDPVPERAQSLVIQEERRGIPARGVEARGEEILSSREFKHLPLILSVDNPEAIATALETTVLASSRRISRRSSTAVRLEVEQNELVIDGGLIFIGDCRRKCFCQIEFLEESYGKDL
jgi:hypothetical protein